MDLEKTIGNTSNKCLAALYCRLSHEDSQDGESNSIENQKKLLQSYAESNGFARTRMYIDDGYSGTIFDRPGFNEMLVAIESGIISTVIVKDLSRLGRNYLQVGYYLEDLFPNYGIRFISINENIDSLKGLDELIPFRNVMNELYAKEISKKIKTSLLVKGRSGVPIGLPPYGYKSNPENPKKWIIDNEAADVVRRVFKLYLSGNNFSQIAAILEGEKILSPLFYWESKGEGRGGKKGSVNPYKWSIPSVTKILSQQEYVGDIINFKTYNKSLKDKKRLPADESDRLVFEDIHDPIIGRDVWIKTQKMRQKAGRRKKQTEEQILFTGLLLCSSCGSKLHFHTNQSNSDIKYFNCSNYNNSGATCKGSHYIRFDFLQSIVLFEINRMLQYASLHPNEFIDNIKDNECLMKEKELVVQQAALDKLLEEESQQTKILERLYQDRINGVITESRFQKLTIRFNESHTDLSGEIRSIRKEIAKLIGNKASPERFISMIAKYNEIRYLNRDIICDFIDCIEVFHQDIIKGERVQTVRISFNHIGCCGIPHLEGICNTNISICPRKGVHLKYIPLNEYETSSNRI
ncbi:MAG: recombinase family protein [Clostridiales bacterium]|nr:recombinase family protein [Clostridiales bacterium]